MTYIKIILFVYLFPATPERVYNECVYQGVKHPDIVTRQFILETGHGKSRKCKENNNLFGLISRSGKFKTWVDCVTAYKEDIQEAYYKGGDYYDFLNCMWTWNGECKRYAEAINYTNKLKQIKWISTSNQNK